jgi:hypothetical protein
MAVRPLILVLGDETARGKRPVSELTAINPDLDKPQEDALIWDHGNLAWKELEPGVNTDPNGSGTTFWGVESLLRRELDSIYEEGTPVHFLKYATPSQLSTDTRSTPTWTEGDSLTCLLDLVFARITAAASVTAGVGDTLQLAGVVISIQQLDPLTSSWRAYGELMRSLVDRIRGSQLPIAQGSIRGDGQKAPVVLIEPHYAYTPLAWNFRMRVVQGRVQIQQLACEPDRVAVARCHQLTSTDGATFSATSMLELAKRCAKGLLAPASVTDATSPEAHISLLVGDSIVDGIAPNASLPAHLQGALTGALIWSPYAGTFATLQPGVNNSNSAPNAENGQPPFSFQVHGPEVYVADHFRTVYGTGYMVKGSLANSFGAANQQAFAIELAPTLDRLLTTWSPGARGQAFDMTVRGWFRSAVDWLRQTSKKPILDLVVISVGTNDLLPYCTPEAVPAAVLDLVQSIRRVCLQDNVSTSNVKFVILMPSSLVPAQGPDLDAIRSGLQALEAGSLSDARFIDLTDIDELTSDRIHPTGPGNAALGQMIIDAYRFQPIDPVAAVEPMFVPTKLELRKALRMSKISDDSDALSMIDAAIQSASVLFYRTLGPVRIASLQAIAYPKAPTSDTEFLRVLAAATEIKVVRAELLRTIPTMFMDGSIAEKSWQEEAGFRYNSNLALRDELKRLEAEIQGALAQLIAMQLTAGGAVSVTVVAPDTTSSPGESIQSLTL